MDRLNTEELIDIFDKAVKMNLNMDFIEIIKDELFRRGILTGSY
jgi:hypothetical protein